MQTFNHVTLQHYQLFRKTVIISKVSLQITAVMDTSNSTIQHDHATSARGWSNPCRNLSVTTTTKVSNFAMAYFTIPISLMATMSNIIILYTLYKVPRLKSASSILLVFLSVADLPNGLFVQPIFVLFCVHDVLGSCVAGLRVFHAHFAHLICSCSAFMIAVISIDRCIQVSYPLKSRAWNLKKVYTYISCSSWLGLAVINASRSVMTEKTFNTLSIFFITSVIFIAIASYAIIYRIIRNNRCSDFNSGVNSRVHKQRLLRQKRASRMIKVIFTALFACYLPRLLCTIIKQATDVNQDTIYHFERWSAFFVFLNAAINPIIYCAGMEDIRTEVIGILSMLKSWPHSAGLMKRN